MENHEPILVPVDRSLAEILPAYLVNRREDAARLAGLLERGEFETMRVLGHRMRGSGAGYGLDAISRLGERLEKAARSGSQADLAASVADLDAFLRRLVVVYTDDEII
ncbi:MAG: Hpt domain-containing protein [Magnetococcales bacterium]|nr:Hpt domain-containing protein [Magnetococcales bacterium]